MKNKLICADNLKILKTMQDNSIDLIYIDPPFCTQKDRGYKDTWKWNKEIESYYNIIKDCKAIRALKILLDRNYLFTYLVYMYIRIIELHRVLKPTGSIYLHCDPTASHYLKLVMDAVFGVKNFTNEIIWCYSRMASKNQRHFNKNHDVIFRYSKSNNYIFNVDSVRMPYSLGSQKREGYKKTSLGGGAPKSLKCELNPRGKFPEDWWQDIPFIRGKQRLGYPTQKPEALLQRIVKASSNKGDIILDAFCGCGTTLVVAQKLKREWIGIDISPTAIEITKLRLNK